MIKRKVLVISVSNKGKGGVASVVTTFMNNAKLNNKYDLTYYHSHEAGSVFLKVLTMLKSYLEFPLLLLKTRYEVAHIHGSLKGSFFRKSYFLLWLKLFSIPTIYQIHAAKVDEYFTALNFAQKKLVEYIFSKYNLALCLGSPWQPVLKNYTKIEWDILYNPVPQLELNKIKHDLCNFTFMGELSQRKGIKDLLHAFSLADSNDMVLNIAGNGDINSLRILADELGISQRVNFLGWIDTEQRERILEITDVVVLPSYAEGLPMSMLEAMSASIPVITTAVGAVEDAITDGVEGILIKPGDISALSSSLNLLSENEKLRVAMGDNAKVKFLRFFSDDVVVEALSSYYNKLSDGE